MASNSLFVLLDWMGLDGFQKPICLFGLDGIRWPPIAYLFYWIGCDWGASNSQFVSLNWMGLHVIAWPQIA